jgi:apolipoprotein D and lipocalin family protein
MRNVIFLSGIIALFASHSWAAATGPLIPVKDFQLDKYLGMWYEIARMPSPFEKDLVKVTATYKLRNDGKVDVINEGYKSTKDNKKKIAHGKAKFSGAKDIGYLKVSFFGPFYADYIIVSLDSENYQYALVASGKYLWILSRTPQLAQPVLDSLLSKAKELGFDVQKLIYSQL